MSEPYQHYPGHPQYFSPGNALSIRPDGYGHDQHQLHSLSSENLRQSYIEFEDGGKHMLPAHAKTRRRSSTATDHVKHRRTRSGCFTCRNRRVKCDETHPVCERCRKGNRECIYPEPRALAKTSRGVKSKSSPQDSGSASEDLEHEGKEGLPPIPDDEDYPDSSNPPHVGAPFASLYQRDAYIMPVLTPDKSPSPSTEGSFSVVTPITRPAPSRTSSRQSLRKSSSTNFKPQLPRDVEKYLNYFREGMSYHHYCFRVDGADFMRTDFLEIAMRNEPLLYAVVGFAAYFHTLSRPDGRIGDFLPYYNRSVSLLRASIQRSTRHNVATLLTILQLATIEELLGDWVNLMGHQKAAYEIITSLYTPHTIMHNETSRRILQWYMRFDLFVGFQAGYETVLGREWPEACYQYYRQQVRDKPHDLISKYEERFACTRLLATDSATLFARKARGAMSDDQFISELQSMSQRFAEYENSIDPMLTDFSFTQEDISQVFAIDADDIVDLGDPNFHYYMGDRWPTNFVFIDYWAIKVMFNYALSMALHQPPSQETVQLAYKILQMFEAIERGPEAPAGVLIETQASLGIAALFLPKDSKHIMWCRRKFAKVESCGYIYPATMRTSLSNIWGVDVTHWWLPDDELCPPIIRAVRDFIQERNAEPRDQTTQDLKIMKGIFSRIELEDNQQNPAGNHPPGPLGIMGVVPIDDGAAIYQDCLNYGCGDDHQPY